MKLPRPFLVVALLAFTSCAGMGRGCSRWQAENMGADWVVVQLSNDGKPFNCWKLDDVSVTNEPASDGVYWKTPSGHLIHISGWYNRVQVKDRNFQEAAKQLGVDIGLCKEGRYTTP